MAVAKTTAKKPVAKKAPAKKPAAPKKDSNALVKMIRDDGKEAMVHPTMIGHYKSSGYMEA